MQNKSLRQSAANQRNATWQKLNYDQQLKALDHRLGVNIGAKKQRTKIHARQELQVAKNKSNTDK